MSVLPAFTAIVLCFLQSIIRVALKAAKSKNETTAVTNVLKTNTFETTLI